MSVQAWMAQEAQLAAAGLRSDEIDAVVGRALQEDLRDGPDVTTMATVGPDVHGTALMVSRQSGVLAGGPLAVAVFDQVLGGDVQVDLEVADGGVLAPGTVALRVEGALAGLLTAERTALNLVTHLSGIATETRRWVDAVAGTGAVVRDTRKTLPGLRSLEKYAVRCGGGRNHRMSLGDAALIKDNHVAAAGSVGAAIAAVRSLRPDIALEVEVDTLDQLTEALDHGATLVLLDNFSLRDTATAVRRAAAYPEVRLEASGGLTLDRAHAVAATGVHYLAVGALTHSAPALDLGLDLT
ncbi:carboxylating nicotinate-nucleotide diphosphorylase [Nakamurella deserti]|uniref:carboxylating nicotinate-nucleotide diphosphorylase n=1 Tax=Nakamurella deserti TaxID=2164074 RepID=UPI000DBE8FCF|nr:carboxylating nicotinate-nucleotide diphosphorylase [Nakamurella deserti]